MSKKHHRYDHEFKVAAVKLVTEQGYTAAEAARNLGVNDQTLRNWLRRFGPDPAAATSGNGQADADLIDKDAEIARLRKQVRRLEMEREILEKATAFFAKESE